MKTHLLAAALAATSLAAMVASSSLAATNLNSSKSNVYKAITTAADEAACAKAGGTVVVQDGKKVCSLPAPAEQ